VSARPLVSFGVLALASGALAQVNLGSTFSAVATALNRQGAGFNNSAARPQNPLEPTGFPPPPGKEEELPPPRQYGPQERVVQIMSPSRFTQNGSHIHASEGVHARYLGYDMYGDVLDGDTQTRIFTLTGHVKVVGADSVVNGTKVTVNLRDNTFISERGDVDLRPNFFPLGRVQSDIYVRGASEWGSRRELFGNLTEVTTCNLPDPHFELIAKSTDLRPYRRVIMRNVSLYILRRHILTIPYLSIPLDDRSSRYTPEVGHTPDEGYYVRLKVPVALHSNNDFLDARTDYYTKIGPALGADFSYQNRNLNGLVNLYTFLQGSRQLSLNLRHDQHIGRSDFTLDSSYQKGNYLISSDSTLLNTRAQLTIPSSNGTFDQLMFTRNTNSSQGFNSSQQIIGLNDSRVFSPRTRSTLNLSLSDNSSSFAGGESIVSKELDVQFDANSDLKKATAELQYLRNIPIGQNNNSFFGVSDQTPVFTLKSDATRLLSRKLAPEFPFQVDLSTGNFGTPGFLGGEAQHINRTNFDFAFTRPDHPQRRFDVQLNGRFQQGLYSDDTAQYVTGMDSAARYTLGRDTSLNLRYSYLQQHGFTPLEFDRTGRTNMFTSDVSFRPFRNLLLGAQSGYDFLQIEQQQTPWQSVGVRSEWTPRPWFQLRGLATYDTFQHAWSNIRFDLGYKPGATFVSAGVRYDGILNRVGEVNIFVDGFKWGRLKTSMILDYDGYIRQFAARHFSFTYDLHCAEAILQILDNPTGYRPGTQIAFFIRLKAFPFNTPFGIGNRGQVVGSGTGRDFY
jgi:hypothetical protein